MRTKQPPKLRRKSNKASENDSKLLVSHQFNTLKGFKDLKFLDMPTKTIAELKSKNMISVFAKLFRSIKDVKEIK